MNPNPGLLPDERERLLECASEDLAAAYGLTLEEARVAVSLAYLQAARDAAAMAEALRLTGELLGVGHS